MLIILKKLIEDRSHNDGIKGLQGLYLLSFCECYSQSTYMTNEIIARVAKHPWFLQTTQLRTQKGRPPTGHANRVWWLCYSRDIEVACYNLSDPYTILCTKDISPPSIDDFDLSYQCLEDNKFTEVLWPHMFDNMYQVETALSCIKRSKLMRFVAAKDLRKEKDRKVIVGELVVLSNEIWKQLLFRLNRVNSISATDEQGTFHTPLLLYYSSLALTLSQRTDFEVIISSQTSLFKEIPPFKPLTLTNIETLNDLALATCHILQSLRKTSVSRILSSISFRLMTALCTYMAYSGWETSIAAPLRPNYAHFLGPYAMLTSACTMVDIQIPILQSLGSIMHQGLSVRLQTSSAQKSYPRDDAMMDLIMDESNEQCHDQGISSLTQQKCSIKGIVIPSNVTEYDSDSADEVGESSRLIQPGVLPEYQSTQNTTFSTVSTSISSVNTSKEATSSLWYT
jgi:hypothetical protein